MADDTTGSGQDFFARVREALEKLRAETESQLDKIDEVLSRLDAEDASRRRARPRSNGHGHEREPEPPSRPGSST